MNWITKYYYLPQYEYTSSNQHGNRFKRTGEKELNIVMLSCDTDDSAGLTRLILLSHTLNVPVHYDFEDHKAYIEVMSADAVRGNL